ncbi:MAG TPA: DUF222 domain-containing protein [Mycobacteriales bacterium]|nr:DUF222 domain-containing protein [Mycobacteriales bacterium]
MAVLHPANETLYSRAAVELSRLEQLPVGGTLYAGLIALEAIPLGSAAAVRAAALWTSLVSHCQARAMIPLTEATTGCDLLASGVDRNEAKQLVGEEIAVMTHLSTGAGIGQVYLVDQIGTQLPMSWEALDRGELTIDHVRRLARVTRACAPRVAQAVDAHVVPAAIARGWTPGELHSAAMKAVIEVDPDGAADRAAKAKAAADVRVFPATDETAVLEANGDAATLRQVMDAIEARAAALAADGDRLPVGLRRFNALADLVLGRAADRPNVEVVLTMDLTTWLGLNHNPGELSGYGPISAEAARALANDANFRRLITDPTSRATLDLGTRRYRPTAALRRFIWSRDRTCQFPGCNRPARATDLDHRTNFTPDGSSDDGGKTNPDNLHCLCRMHHNHKTRKHWRAAIAPDGTETWTSALGYTYRTRPGHRHLPPLDPPDDLDELPATILEIVPEHDPDPPYPSERDLIPPPLDDWQYREFVDAYENSFGAFADRAYDTLRAAGLIA